MALNQSSGDALRERGCVSKRGERGSQKGKKIMKERKLWLVVQETQGATKMMISFTTAAQIIDEESIRLGRPFVFSCL